MSAAARETTTPVAPPVNGQVIGQAHYATRAVLDRLLATTGTTFHQSVALNAASDAGGETERDRLVDRMTAALKIEAATARATTDELVGAGLLEELPGTPARLRVTPAGEELHRTHRSGAAGITARLYDGLPADDLAVAGRVLATVTDRANAVLAGN